MRRQSSVNFDEQHRPYLFRSGLGGTTIEGAFAGVKPWGDAPTGVSARDTVENRRVVH